MARKRLATITAIVGIMIVLFTGAGSCGDDSNQPSDGSGGTTQGNILKACNTTISRQPNFDPKTNLMQAETHSECDRAPDSHVVTITLWYHPYPNGKVEHPKFKNMGNSNTGAFPGQNAYPGCGVAPHPGDPTDCIVAKRGICKVGIWKMTVLVTGSMGGKDFGGPGNPSFKLSNKEEQHVHIDHCAAIQKP